MSFISRWTGKTKRRPLKQRRRYPAFRRASQFLESLELREMLAVMIWSGADGDFDDAAKWAGGAVPGAQDVATILGINGNVVGVTANATVDELVTDGPGVITFENHARLTSNTLWTIGGTSDVDVTLAHAGLMGDWITGGLAVGGGAKGTLDVGSNQQVTVQGNGGLSVGGVDDALLTVRGLVTVTGATQIGGGGKDAEVDVIGQGATFQAASVYVAPEASLYARDQGTIMALDVAVDGAAAGWGQFVLDDQSTGHVRSVVVLPDGHFYVTNAHQVRVGTSVEVDGDAYFGNTNDILIGGSIIVGLTDRGTLDLDTAEVEVLNAVSFGTAQAGADVTIDGSTLTSVGGFIVTPNIANPVATVVTLKGNSLWDAGASDIDVQGAKFDIEAGSRVKAQNFQAVALDSKVQGAGTLEAFVDIQAGEISPGDTAADTLEVDGDYRQGNAGTLLAQIGPTSDVLEVSGSAQLGGWATVTALGGAQFQEGDTFDILVASSINGTFSNLPAGSYDSDGKPVGGGAAVLPPTGDPKLSWKVSYGAHPGETEESVRLEVVKRTVAVHGFNADEYDHDMEFAIELNEAADYDVTVHYNVTAGTASIDEDYSIDEPSGTVVIPQGETVAYVTVHVYGDYLASLGGSPEYEGDEDLTIELTQVEGAQPDEDATTATGTIRDILISIDWSGEVSEGDEVATVYVNASAPPFELPVVVYYSTQDGTATATASPPDEPDYEAAPMNAYTILNPGDWEAPIDVPITDDEQMESDEDFWVQLLGTDETFAVLDDASLDSLVTIHDNDEPPVIYIYDLEHPEDKDGGSGDVKLSLEGDDYGLVYEVAWHLEGGSATPGDDFATPASGVLYFGSGHDIDQYVTVWVADDYDDEPDEEFYVVIDSVTGGASMDYTMGDGTVTIKDDDKRYRVTALYVDPYDSPETTPLESWFEYEEIREQNTETVAEGSETSDDEPDPAWLNGGYISGYAQLTVYTNYEYDIEVPEYVTGYDVTAISADFYDYEATSPDESWHTYEELTAPDTETVPAGTEESIGSEDPAWLNGGYHDGYTQLTVYANEEFDETVEEYLVGYDVSAIYVEPFDSDATEPDPSWYAYEEITAPNTETVPEGAEQYLGGADPAWVNGGYDTGETENDEPIFANYEYEREIEGTHVVGYHVTAIYESFYSEGDTVDESWAAYEPRMENTQTVPRGTYTSLGSPDPAWTNGGYDTGETEDNLEEPIYRNNEYERDLGTTHLIGYHITAIWVESFYSEGDTIDPSWVEYQARTSTTQTIADGTYESTGAPDPAWTNGGYDTGRTEDDLEHPIWANYEYEREVEGTHVVGHRVTAEYCDPFFGGGLIDESWAEYEEVEEE